MARIRQPIHFPNPQRGFVVLSVSIPAAARSAQLTTGQ
jgi:hypothetical protein